MMARLLATALQPRCKVSANRWADDESMNTTRNTTSAVDGFLTAVAAGRGIPAHLYAPDATLDATVPNWRFTRRGAEAISSEYGGWFGAPGAFEELTRSELPGGEVVTYLLTWTEAGVPHAAHHCHVLTVDSDDRIVSDTVFCGGRWPAGLLAEMAAAS
jgi:hypothetical protein